MTRRFLIVLGVALVAAAVILLPKQPLQTATLAKRIEAARLTWPNYDEDVKAQLGAQAVSEWRGAPLAARLNGRAVEVEVALQGPWAGRSLALPLLLRTPQGTTYTLDAASIRDGAAVYRFELGPGETEAPLPWVELRYPRGETVLNVARSAAFREAGAPSAAAQGNNHR